MKRILLVVDDEPSVTRTVWRMLHDDFDLVLTAQDSPAAEKLLQDPDALPTHLLSDHNLGVGQPLGADLIPAWRRKYPHLRVAALMTGARISDIVVGEGVDRVFEKPLCAADLRRFFVPTDSIFPDDDKR